MDKLDSILEQWRQARPDVDCTAMAVVGRLGRLVIHLQNQLAGNFAAFGLKDGEFDVLATLRRAGGADGLCPTDLYTSLMLTSGAVSKRLDRLEAAGWVSRQPNPDDRRALRIHLTPAGLALIDRALEGHVAAMEDALAPLAPEQRAQLASLLKHWLQGFPGESQG
ncbi:MarR family winged helix-turn-helix transcriptional regulator [Chromobacterium sp. IIBBL 290-4]|uniref:MarR family winged helix-turn-helix transcriptional regulator n=1 Tax=Chromobacterium sp. IIBBL 290-4 TaxID=2953890 RepID=UPI0020B8ED10|nr:MarR family transcriptional regulator [Chromobacterium sp. IIBBL 290-4]UTH75508.1 MarR family transcriptional regulator [Chromobacterium sp. IIBBL 290-4]